MEKKSNWQEYKAVLDEQKIAKLYHFTDRDNLESIIKNGGLYSWMECERKGIKIAKCEGEFYDSTSHDVCSHERRENL